MGLFGGSTESSAEYINSTGCHHIQEVLASIADAGMSIEDFAGTDAYDLLISTVDLGSVLGAEAASSYTSSDAFEDGGD